MYSFSSLLIVVFIQLSTNRCIYLAPIQSPVLTVHVHKSIIYTTVQCIKRLPFAIYSSANHPKYSQLIVIKHLRKTSDCLRGFTLPHASTLRRLKFLLLYTLQFLALTSQWWCYVLTTIKIKYTSAYANALFQQCSRSKVSTITIK